MPDTIIDGGGKGYQAKVNSDNRLLVDSVSRQIENFVCRTNKESYQLIGTSTLSSGTVVAIHVKNNSTTKQLIITRIRHQIIDQDGGTSFPNSSNYFKVALGRTYVSGGSTITSVNTYQGSGNIADITSYGSNPTLTGTALEIDRWYTKAEGDMNIFNKDGSIIISPNQTIELSYVGDQTGGTIYTRLSFLMDEIEN